MEGVWVDGNMSYERQWGSLPTGQSVWPDTATNAIEPRTFITGNEVGEFPRHNIPCAREKVRENLLW